MKRSIILIFSQLDFYDFCISGKEVDAYCKPEDLRKCADVAKGPSSAKPAISCGTIAYSSTLVHGLHMHSSGALVITFRNFFSPGFALGQKSDTLASLSPLS